jgi:hypothetical protein
VGVGASAQAPATITPKTDSTTSGRHPNMLCIVILPSPLFGLISCAESTSPRDRPFPMDQTSSSNPYANFSLFIFKSLTADWEQFVNFNQLLDALFVIE